MGAVVSVHSTAWMPHPRAHSARHWVAILIVAAVTFGVALFGWPRELHGGAIHDATPPAEHSQGG